MEKFGRRFFWSQKQSAISDHTRHGSNCADNVEMSVKALIHLGHLEVSQTSGKGAEMTVRSQNQVQLL